MSRCSCSTVLVALVAAAAALHPRPAAAQLPVTSLVKDIEPGFDGAAPFSLTRVGGSVFFFAMEGDAAIGLYTSDSSAAGTVRLRTFTSFVGEIENVGGIAYFTASPDSGPGYYALWKSDGTAAGTVMIKSLPGYPYELTAVGTRLFFGMAGTPGNEELWTSDGTAAGTVLVKDIEPGSGGSFPADLTAFNGRLYFSAFTTANGVELWVSDGTPAGTVLVKDIAPGGLDSSPFYLTVVGDALYFAAVTPEDGDELWMSDGTPGGTNQVKDLVPGADGAGPYELTAVGTTLFFAATIGLDDTELYTSDGTATGTARVRDVVPGPSGSTPLFLTNVNGVLFFAKTDVSGPDELWKSDGTEGGTVKVAALPGMMNPLGAEAVAAVNGRLLFAAEDPAAGIELWQSDGTAAGTQRIADIEPGSDDSLPDLFEVLGDTLLFTARNSGIGHELWRAKVPGVITGPPVLATPATALVVGASNTLAGSAISPGTVVKLFVATASGTVSHGPFIATATTTAGLSFTIPPTVPLGNGFGALQVVATDRGYLASNVVGALLAGSPAAGIPTVQQINGVALAPPEPGIALAHIDTVIAKGSTVAISGIGFSDPLVNLFTATGNLGPLTPRAGGTATRIEVVVPAGAPTGPGNFQVVNRPKYTISNAVSTIIGARPAITSVSLSGTTVRVSGAGFSSLSVINLYNTQGATVVNLGGFGPGGVAKVPLALLSDREFTFRRPASAVAGPAFVEVLNPPFTPFSSSSSDPDGAFTFPVLPPSLTLDLRADGLPSPDGPGHDGLEAGQTGPDAPGRDGTWRRERVVWTQHRGSDAGGAGEALVAADAPAEARGARSTRALVAGDGEVSWQVPAGGTVIAGFGHGDEDGGADDVDHGIGVTGTTREVFVVENGVRRAAVGSAGANDRFRVRVRAGTVEYWRDDTLLWVSSSEPKYPLVADASLDSGGVLLDARIAGQLGDVVDWRHAGGAAVASMRAMTTRGVAALEGPVLAGSGVVSAELAGAAAIGFASDAARRGAGATSLLRFGAAVPAPDACRYCLVVRRGRVQVWHAGELRGNWRIDPGARYRVEAGRDAVRYWVDDRRLDEAPRHEAGPLTVSGLLRAGGARIENVTLEAAPVPRD
jgi:ELWxxDGT repeat protein